MIERIFDNRRDFGSLSVLPFSLFALAFSFLLLHYLEIFVAMHRVASGSRDSSVKLWNIRSGHCVHHLTGHLAAVRCVQYNGRIVVSGSYDFSILIWNAETGARMHQLQGHGNRIYSLLVWPPSSSQSLGHPNLHPFHPLYPFSSSASSACGPSGCSGSGPAPRELIISGSLDTHVKVWDLNTGDLVHTLSGHSSLTSSMEVANNGQTLITANADQVQLLFSLYCTVPVLSVISADLFN